MFGDCVCVLELIVSFQLGYPGIAAWLERGLCVSPAGKDSTSLALLLNSVSSQISK